MAAGVPAIRVRKPIVHRRRSSNGPALAALGVLLVVAGGLGYAVVGPDGVDRLLAGKGLAPLPKPAKQIVAQEPVSPPAPPSAYAATPAKAPAPPPVATNDPPAAPRARTPEPVPQPVSPPPPPPPEIEPPAAIDDEARRAIDEQLARGLEALRNEDFPGAAKAFTVAADRAAGDADVLDRVSRWQLLADYARQFPRHRDAALQAAGKGRDYEIGARKIGVVEVNDQQFIYRENGKNIRVPRNAIPDDILLAIVEAWFAGADKAGNHMILGAIHITRPRPDLEGARREWSVAASRDEPTGRALLRLLDDPLLETATSR